MSTIDLGVLELVYSFLSLLPGFVAFQSYLYFSKEAKEYDQFETTTWSLLGSGVALFVLYGTVLAIRSVAEQQLVLSVQPLPSLEILILGYPLLLLTSLALGVVSGHILDELRQRRGVQRVRDPPWEFWKRMLAERQGTVEELLGQGPADVTILTKEGTEIVGQLFVAGSIDTERDVFLAWPKRIIRGDNHEIVDRVSLGKFAYIHEDDLLRITFDQGQGD